MVCQVVLCKQLSKSYEQERLLKADFTLKKGASWGRVCKNDKSEECESAKMTNSPNLDLQK